jgi:hypothetical protein
MSFNEKNMTVVVMPSEHAALDSFPLRYGIRFSDEEKTQIDLFDCKDHKETRNKRLKVTANFIGQDDEILTGRFILSDQNPPRTVVTVIRPDNESEDSLSDLLTLLRKKKKISVEDLLEWHPLYLKGAANTFEQLIELIGKKHGLVSKKEQEDLKATLNEVFKHWEQAEDELREVKGENQNLAMENQEQKEEIERLKAEKAKAVSQDQVVMQDEPRILIKVDRDINYHGSRTTRLTFEDGSQNWMKVATFDQDLSVTKRAENYIGKRVRTSCWNPKNDPGKWSRMGYFRNIYLADYPPTQPG